MIKRCIFIIATTLLVSCSNPETDFQKAEQANTEQAYSDFIQKHPDNPLVAQASTKIEQLALNAAQTANTIPAWEAFLKQHPQSTNAVAGRERLADLLLAQLNASNTIAAYEAFARQYAGTPAASTAAKLAETLDYQATTNANNSASYNSFLASRPSSAYAKDIHRRIEDLAWHAAWRTNSETAFLDFLRAFPQSGRIRLIQGQFDVNMIPQGVEMTEPAEVTERITVHGDASRGIVRLTRSNTSVSVPYDQALRWELIKKGPVSKDIEYSTFRVPASVLAAMGANSANTYFLPETELAGTLLLLAAEDTESPATDYLLFSITRKVSPSPH